MSASRVVLVGTVQCNPEEVLEPDGDWALLLRVSLAKGVCEALDFDAKNDELVNGDFFRCRVVNLNQELNKLLAEAEAHLGEGLPKLRLFNGSGLIAIIRFEAVQPLIHVVEQFIELDDIDGAGLILVEHGNHQSTGLIGEVLAFAVDERCLEFLRVNLAAAVFVDLIEEI